MRKVGEPKRGNEKPKEHFEIGEALGPGTHDEAARQATRDRLRAERAARAREEWAVEARGRARIRMLAAPEKFCGTDR